MYKCLIFKTSSSLLTLLSSHKLLNKQIKTKSSFSSFKVKFLNDRQYIRLMFFFISKLEKTKDSDYPAKESAHSQLTNLSISENLKNSNRRQSWGSFSHLNTNAQAQTSSQCLHHQCRHLHNNLRNTQINQSKSISHQQASSNNLKTQQSNRHSLIPQYYQSSIQNLNQSLNR